MTLLVVGARPDSLGAAVAMSYGKRFSKDVTTAGITGEDEYMDVTDQQSIYRVVEMVRPENIIVTVGINEGVPIDAIDYAQILRRSLMVNATGVMAVLNNWLLIEGPNFIEQEKDSSFVAISSNSASIARTGSSAYCASKAALSMALRVAARELQGRPLVYGYELGLLRGTPMTAATEQRFGPTQTRMKGAPEGLDTLDVADQILNDLMHPWQGRNGSLLRLDAGEQ